MDWLYWLKGSTGMIYFTGIFLDKRGGTINVQNINS